MKIAQTHKPRSVQSTLTNVPMSPSWQKQALSNRRLSISRNLSPVTFHCGWTCSLRSANINSHTNTHTDIHKEWVWLGDYKHVRAHSTALHTIRKNLQHQQAHKSATHTHRHSVGIRFWSMISERISCWKKLVGSSWFITWLQHQECAASPAHRWVSQNGWEAPSIFMDMYHMHV